MDIFQLSFEIGIMVFLVALIAEYFDSSLGMGYGTSLTPVLLALGFTPLQVVPMILLAELVSGFFAAFSHTKLGNVNFNIKDNRAGDSNHLKVALLLGGCSIIGTVAAVFIAISLSPFYLKLYIGLLISVIGLYIIFNGKKEHVFSWKRIIGLGMIASFNKGMSGGGYGPVVTGGQILAGIKGKNAVAITSLAEGLTCIVGFALYAATTDKMDYVLAPYLLLGAIVSVPFSTLTIKVVNEKRLKKFIGWTTLFLGLFTLYKIFIG